MDIKSWTFLYAAHTPILFIGFIVTHALVFTASAHSFQPTMKCKIEREKK